jgi:hypothetical protein
MFISGRSGNGVGVGVGGSGVQESGYDRFPPYERSRLVLGVLFQAPTAPCTSVKPPPERERSPVVSAYILTLPGGDAVL